MAISLHKCPVCEGEGERNNKMCKACKGKGYIETRESEEKRATRKGMIKYGKKEKT